MCKYLHMYVCTYVYITIRMYVHALGMEMVKKHYNNLWMSLPANHTTTLERLLSILVCPLSDEALTQIVSSTNSEWANMMILNYLISLTANDNQLLGLSFLIERFATGDVFLLNCPDIESFRNG